MSVQEVSRRAGPFEGNGSTKEFSFHFKVFNADNVAVYVSDEDDGDVQLTQGYTVELNADQDALPGGTVILTDPLPDGQRLSILSCVPYDQPMVLTNQGGFYPRTINDSADRLAIQVQQLLEEMKRTLKVPATSSMTPWGLLLQIFQAAESAATSAEEAEKYAQICEEIKQYVEVYSWDIPHLVDSIRDVEDYPYDGYFWVRGFGKVPPGQDISNRYVKADGSTELRTLGERFADIVNVKDFGAVGDGVTDDTEAFIKANAFGRIVVPAGEYLLGSVSLTSDVIFMLGASITAKAQATVELMGQINSPKQYIFRGEGAYLIKSKTGITGEQYKETHCSWWGVFPGGETSALNAQRLSKAFSAYGNEKEGILHFDIGGYHLEETVEVPRAVVIKGAGTRRTVFVPHSDGWPIFKTIGDGARFEDIQFETATSGQPWEILLRSSPAIQLDANHGVIQNVIFTNHENAVIVNGDSCTTRDITFSVDTQNGSEGSAYLTIRGSYFVADGIYCNFGQSYCSKAIVNISPPNAIRIMRGITIRNISTISPCCAVTINANQNSIVGVEIEGINYHPIASTTVDSVVHIFASNSKYVSSIVLSNYVVNEIAKNIVSLNVDSGGSIAFATAFGISAFGSSASGSGFLLSVPEENGGEVIRLSIGATNINRQVLVSSPEDRRVIVKQVVYE